MRKWCDAADEGGARSDIEACSLLAINISIGFGCMNPKKTDFSSKVKWGTTRVVDEKWVI
ncbi:hypothetical protein [Proteiniphilum sp. UBA1028]|jgi:hypothetical protein|uniref:hypothetical protein n=1 Tax=Proteiniphilum sp. UBA1028 TaxID=1947251 RepID=UPI0025DE5909|nr:hypothetical protein [Proteiniphilum sp. UBA1028]